jgi:hypothetical protein
MQPITKPTTKGKAIRYSYNDEGKVEYIGTAVAGSLTSDNVWAIKKSIYDTDKGYIIQNANACGCIDAIFSWDKRDEYTYE